MLAGVKIKNQYEIQIQELQDPALSEKEVLIELLYCGVCGSDLHALIEDKGYEFVEHPIILGHEAVGTVVKAFNQEHNYLIGKKVIIEAIHYCGECKNCLDNRQNICEKFKVTGLHFNGGMAQYIKCPIHLMQEVKPDLPVHLAALTEPMSVAIHAVEYITKVKNNDRVWVQGAGIIGYFIAIVSKHIGANVTIAGLPKDVENRLKFANNFSLEKHIEGESPEPLEKVDVFFECSGSIPGINAGLNRVRKGGKFTFVALYNSEVSININTYIRNEIQFNTTYSTKSDEYGRAQEILYAYKDEINSLVKIYQLNNINDAFLDSMNQQVLKAVIQLKEEF